MARVTGIGGFFFRALDPEALNRWYAELLDVVITPHTDDDPAWVQDRGETLFAACSVESEMFGPLAKSWTIHFRVDDLDAMTQRLRDAGVAVQSRGEAHPNGRFAELEDPEGNRIALWEPGAASRERDRQPGG